MYVLRSLLWVVYFCSSFAKEETQLLFIQMVFRHGDRAPVRLYPNDPNPESVWAEGLGSLTLLGRKQHYGLGELLHSTYRNFVTSSPLEVKVLSSDCDRCMKSAQTNLASFYSPNGNWQFEKQLHWQPISIHYIPQDEDKYLETESYCPRAVQERKRILNSPEGQQFIKEHQEMFKNLSFYSGLPISNWSTASYLHDTLFIEKKYNLTVPSWAAPYWNELRNVSNLSFYWSFNSPLMHRLRAGPLLGLIVEKMNQKLSGDLPNQKVQIYSTHDTNVAVVLGALKLFNMLQPPYCASLIFELHMLQQGGGAVVRLLYFNSSTPENVHQNPHVLVLEGCSEFCPLEYFARAVAPLVPSDWDAECRLERSFFQKITEKSVAIALVFALIAIIIIVMSIFSLWRLKSRKEDKYAYHLMPMS